MGIGNVIASLGIVIAPRFGASSGFAESVIAFVGIIICESASPRLVTSRDTLLKTSRSTSFRMIGQFLESCITWAVTGCRWGQIREAVARDYELRRCVRLCIKAGWTGRRLQRAINEIICEFDDDDD